jgi:hypothetical protein
VKGIWISHAGVGILLLATAGAGQEKGDAERAPNVVTPLKVQLVVTRQLGDKKISSLAYSFPCNTTDPKFSLNLGVEVPVPVRKGDKVEFLYRSVGSNIECEASALPAGRFDLHFAFEHSSLYGAGAKTGSSAQEQTLESRIDNPTLFRTAKSLFNAVLRDGQTTQSVAAADPLTGEIVTVDVTLTVVK